MRLDKDIIAYFRAVNKGCNTIEYDNDNKNTLYIPLFSTSIEHSLSIHVLDNENLTSSAFALARPMIENYLRAMWIKYCADESIISNSSTRLHLPKRLEALSDEIGAVIDIEDKFHEYKSAIQPIILNMNDFTHGGMQSIVRQYNSNGQLTNLHNRTERGEILKIAVITSLLSYENLLPFMKDPMSLTDLWSKADSLLSQLGN